MLNAWNLAALGVVAALTVATKSPVPIAAGAALEAGWLAFASRPRASAKLFARQHQVAAERAADARRADALASLSADEAERVRRLDERRSEILRACADHRHLARPVLRAEVARHDDVVDAFIELAVSAHREQAYLASVDLADLESETRRAEEKAERAADAAERGLAQKQLEVLLRRREQVDELRRKLARTRTQLELIESTFRMIANEIMLMRTTDQLRGQLDDLVVGVQAVREAEDVGASGVTVIAGAEGVDVKGKGSDNDRKRAAAAAAGATGTRRG